MRCVRLFPQEDRSLVGAAAFCGLTINDFIRTAIEEKVVRSRALRDGGTSPAATVQRLPPRPGARRRLVSVVVDRSQFERIDARFRGDKSGRADFVRAAIAREIAHPSTDDRDPAIGYRDHIFPVMLTDDEKAALINGALDRGMRRAKFIRIAIANAEAADTASRIPSPDDTVSRQVD
jgi:hypothetical protein